MIGSKKEEHKAEEKKEVEKKVHPEMKEQPKHEVREEHKHETMQKHEAKPVTHEIKTHEVRRIVLPGEFIEERKGRKIGINVYFENELSEFRKSEKMRSMSFRCRGVICQEWKTELSG